MSDDLVKRLQDPPFGTETSERNLMAQAAARIAEFDAERVKWQAAHAEACRQWRVEWSLANARAEAAEAQVAKLVEALTEIDGSAGPDHWVPEYQHCRDVARATLSTVKREATT